MKKALFLLTALTSVLTLSGCATTMGLITTKPFHPNAKYTQVNTRQIGNSTQFRILGVGLGPETSYAQALNNGLEKEKGDFFMNSEMSTQSSGIAYQGFEIFAMNSNTVQGEIWREIIDKEATK